MRAEELTPRQSDHALDPDALQALVDRGFSVIGQRMLRSDGMDKATGRAVYTDDLALPAMLHGRDPPLAPRPRPDPVHRHVGRRRPWTACTR